MTMRKRFMASMVLSFVVIVFVFYGLRWAVGDSTKRATKSVSETYVTDISDTMLTVFSNTMGLRMDEVRSLHVDTGEEDQAAITRLMFSARKYGFTHLAYAVDGRCDMLYGAQFNPVNEEQFYAEVEAKHEVLALGAQEDGCLVILFASPCENVITRSMVAALPIEYLDEVLAVERNKLSDYAVVQEDGLAIVNTTGPLSEDIISRMRKGDTFTVNAVVGGVNKFVKYTKLPFAKWYLAIIVDQSYFERLSDDILYQDLMAFVIGLVILSAVIARVFYIYFMIFRQQHEEVQSASRAKSDFLTNMSHDIRTPMNGIVGMAAIALSNIDDKDKLHKCLDTITTSAHYMLGLVNNMLDISGIESGRLSVKNRDFWILELVESVQKTLNFAIVERKHTFTVDTSGVRDEYIHGDDLKISQILINIVNNSIKYTEKGGSISLRVWQQQEYMLFEVKDNGQGISREALPRIYEAFYREDSIRVSDVNGVGLGLSIVKRMVDILDGNISVQSVKGEGSTFTVQIPVSKGDYVYTGEDVVYTDDTSTQKRIMSLNIPCCGRLEDCTVAMSYGKLVTRGKKFVNLASLQYPVTDWSLVRAIESAHTVESEELELEGANILIAEDNELNYEIIHAILEEFGVIVDWAENGETCVQKFSESEVGYYKRIIMDIRMPIMNGYEATRAIRELDREDAKTVPIIAMSADAYAAAVEECMRSGMNAYTSKPVNIEEIVTLLQKGGY